MQDFSIHFLWKKTSGLTGTLKKSKRSSRGGRVRSGLCFKRSIMTQSLESNECVFESLFWL